MNHKILIPAFAALSLFACSDDITKEYNSNTETVVQEVGLTGTLQGAIYNAHSGTRIGGKDLEIYLIQGTSHREPTKIVTDTSSVLAGEYSFSKIPVTRDDMLNSTFKLVVYKPGFQVFESEFSFTAEYEYMLDTNNIKSIDGEVYTEDLTNLLMHEAVINKIGNVFLYPEEREAQDVRIAAFHNGDFQAGLPVTLRRLSNWEAITGTATVGSPTDGLGAGRSTRLVNTVGRFDVLTAETDDDGIATFAAADLVLGASYQAIIGPGEVNDIRFVATKGVIFEAGVITGTGLQEIVMNEAVGPMPAVEIEEVDFNDQNGVLILTLSRGVTIQNTKGLEATANSTGDDIEVTSITATISADGRTITITPKFDRALDDENGESIDITYSSTENNPLTYSTLNYTGSEEPIEVIDLDGGDWAQTIVIEAQ